MIVGRVRNKHEKLNILFPEVSNTTIDFEMLQNRAEWNLPIKTLDYHKYIF